ncbi:MAG: cell wall hydrolase [Lachnospiraceae bacterium]|nr:cell wall hydrolase [Lachnospiraceae bacterium]
MLRKSFKAASVMVLAAVATVFVTAVPAFAGQVDFETFVNSVKGGEFVLSSSVHSDFIDAINSGNTDKAMEIYKDFFDGDDSDGVAFKHVDVSESEASQEGEYKEEKKEEEKAEAAPEAPAKEEEKAEEAPAPEPEAAPEAPAPVQDAQVLGATAPAEGSKYGVSDQEYMALCKICYAEAHTQGEEGMLLIANVILNRVNSYKYPSSIIGVISQPGQFGPVRNGRYAAAVPDAATMSAVNRALSGENHVPGALYFRSAKNGPVWGNRTLVASYGGHLFYV